MEKTRSNFLSEQGLFADARRKAEAEAAELQRSLLRRLVDVASRNPHRPTVSS